MVSCKTKHVLPKCNRYIYMYQNVNDEESIGEELLIMVPSIQNNGCKMHIWVAMQCSNIWLWCNNTINCIVYMCAKNRVLKWNMMEICSFWLGCHVMSLLTIHQSYDGINLWKSGLGLILIEWCYHIKFCYV